MKRHSAVTMLSILTGRIVLITEAQKCIQAHSMFYTGARVIVAVSGGADSIALLAILAHLQSQYQLVLHVAHINHQLRGSEAERDAFFVAKQAKQFKLSFHQQRIDLSALRQRKHLSLQHAARQGRYRFLYSLRAALGATHIALGHTLDDQAETFMMRLLRGSSPHGMTGIPAVRGYIVRPLLQSRRSTILAYLREIKMPWVEDSSNSHTFYTRNRIRLHLLPALLPYNPRLTERLGDLTSIMQAEAEELRGLVDFWRPQIVDSQPGHRMVLSKSAFLAAPLAVQRRLLQEVLAGWNSDRPRMHFRHIESLRHFISACTFAQRLALPENLIVECQGRDSIVISRPRLPTIHPEGLFLPVPGKLVLPATQSYLLAQMLLHLPPDIADPYQAFLDFDRITFPLRVRFWRHGDRFRPLGSDGSQKLQDFFTNRKILRSQRLDIPLVVDQRGIVWVVGHQIADTNKITVATQRILHLQCVKLYL